MEEAITPCRKQKKVALWCRKTIFFKIISNKRIFDEIIIENIDRFS